MNGTSASAPTTSQAVVIPPLSGDDVLVGTVLVLLGIFGLASHLIEILVLLKAQFLKRYVGFRFIMASNLADIINIFYQGIWAGLVILTRHILLPLEWKPWLAIFPDTAWFAMLYMSALIAITRLVCVAWPMKYRQLTSKASDLMCLVVWIICVAQTVYLHNSNWYELFWLDPCCWGLAGDIDAFVNNGSSLFYSILYATTLSISMVCYLITAGLLIYRRKNSLAGSQQEVSSTEIRLIIPCFVSSALLTSCRLITDVVVWSKWKDFVLMVIYGIQSAAPPVLRIAFSPRLRHDILKMLGFNVQGMTLFSTSNKVAPSSSSQQTGGNNR
ncbi:hypothetical protein DdX_05721 [Ditylenchus destructor]|uniref:Uncharacterized protein n=1 Tax=Ditylenchus destructor TaxID=166010 RepID=A0AAD4NCT2_9BILA|nr:hypothetical protein DdX_05721 [Ditylenchus destructor]